MASVSDRNMAKLRRRMAVCFLRNISLDGRQKTTETASGSGICGLDIVKRTHSKDLESSEGVVQQKFDDSKIKDFRRSGSSFVSSCDDKSVFSIDLTKMKRRKSSGEETSYCHLLESSAIQHYTADLLDVSTLLANYHQSTDINEIFRDEYPHIQLSWNKLQTIKEELHRINKIEPRIELSVIAQSYVYFEKLFLGNYINKNTRKRSAGACLLMSAKLNDIKGATMKSMIQVSAPCLFQTSIKRWIHLQAIQSVFHIQRKELISTEFAVMVALKFNLYASVCEIQPHYDRLLKKSSSSH